MRLYRILRQRTYGAWTLVPALAGGERLIAATGLQLWRLRPSPDRETVAAAWALLDEEERARAARYRLTEVRQRFVVVRAALRRLLAAYCERPAAALRLTYGAHGKPALSDCPCVHFNLSHTVGLALCAVSSQPVGVDVERLREVGEGVAPFVLTAEERLVLDEVGGGSSALLRLWVRKEALLKGTGEGLRHPKRVSTLHPPRGWEVIDVVPAQGYVAAVAVKVPAGRTP